jgi:hypothetical protein
MASVWTSCAASSRSRASRRAPTFNKRASRSFSCSAIWTRRAAAGELREELSHHIARANAEAALEARASDRVAVRGVPVSRPMPLTHGFAETQPYTGTNG